jgi:hypothetical protein
MRGASRRIMLASRQERVAAARYKRVLRLSRRARRRVAGAHRPHSLRLETVIVEPRGRPARLIATRR